MSAELLLNTDTTTSKKNNVNSTSLNKNESKEKKEGNSLFDSLMNEAKSETKTEEKDASKKVESKTEKNETNLNINSSNKKSEEIENESDKKTSLKNESKTDEIHSKHKIINSSDESSSSQNNESIKKMVDKLVNIVVNAAKEMFDGKEESSIDKIELKNTVEKIVESKLSNIADKDQLKNVIEKKLDIVKDSVSKIEKESKNISLEDDTISDDKTKKSKEVMQNEVVIIKDNVKELKKDVSTILSTDENESNEKASKSKNDSDDINTNLKNNIEKNLSIIDDSSDEIKTIISKVDESTSKAVAQETVKENNPKIEYKIDKKVETIKEAIIDIKEKVFETIIVKTTGEEIKKLDTSLKSVNIIDLNGKNNSEKPLLASMFLNAQNAMKNKTSLGQINDAKTNIIENKSLDSVKVSAGKLDLNIERTEVDHIEEKGKKPISIEKYEELKTNNLINNRTLNRVLLDQRVELNHINMQRKNEIINKEIISNTETEKRKNIETVEMNVHRDIVQNLQNKIIGAQQKMGSFMSEVARNMYLNYKPPVTAFRVNLNPANLGTISIMMKANKVDNTLSVSMNLSNSNTMESFTENKTLLQNAIQRQFNETSNVTINFNMQDQNSENEFTDFNQNNDQNKQNSDQDNDIESNDIEEQEIIEHNDYM